MPRVPAILFVCLGNICRSPLAEAAFRQAATAAGLAFEADSAGTGDWHAGSPPDPRAQGVAREHGCDISAYRARQLVPGDFLRFDRVLVMDRANLREASRIVPAGARCRPALLLDLVAWRKGAEVADPYYGGEERFEDTWQDVAMAARALVEVLKPG